MGACITGCVAIVVGFGTAVGLEVGIAVSVGIFLAVSKVACVFGFREDGVVSQFEKLVSVIEPSTIRMEHSIKMSMSRLLFILDSRSLPISPGMSDVLMV